MMTYADLINNFDLATYGWGTLGLLLWAAWSALFAAVAFSTGNCHGGSAAEEEEDK